MLLFGSNDIQHLATRHTSIKSCLLQQYSIPCCTRLQLTRNPALYNQWRKCAWLVGASTGSCMVADHTVHNIQAGCETIQHCLSHTATWDKRISSGLRSWTHPLGYWGVVSDSVNNRLAHSPCSVYDSEPPNHSSSPRASRRMWHTSAAESAPLYLELSPTICGACFRSSGLQTNETHALQLRRSVMIARCTLLAQRASERARDPGC